MIDKHEEKARELGQHIRGIRSKCDCKDLQKSMEHLWSMEKVCGLVYHIKNVPAVEK